MFEKSVIFARVFTLKRKNGKETECNGFQQTIHTWIGKRIILR